jgi:hypothetical protein
MSGERARLFRDEALRHFSGAQQPGDLLRISPSWARWSYLVLAAGCSAITLFALLGHLATYQTGPSVLRADARLQVSFSSAALVMEYLALPGQHVAQGAPVVRLEASADAGETEVTLMAPAAGTVTSCAAASGSRVAAGVPLLTLTADGSSYHVTALLPARYLGAVHVGDPLWLSTPEAPTHTLRLAIASVSVAPLGLADASMLLGWPPSLAAGPLITVTARIPDNAMLSDGTPLLCTDGASYQVQARVARRSLLTALLPSSQQAGARR